MPKVSHTVYAALLSVSQTGPTVSVGHRLAIDKATENAELSEQLGLPLTPGPWYNASIGLTHRDNMANCQFTLVGSKHSSDIYMRVGCLYSHPAIANAHDACLACWTLQL